MGKFEKVTAGREEIFEIWNNLSNLSRANIPDKNANYATTRSIDFMQPTMKPLIESREKEIFKKYFERDQKTGEYITVKNAAGILINIVKDGYTFDQYEEALEEFYKGDPIEFEVYKIKMSTLNTATITSNKTGLPVSLPPIIKAALYKTHIIDDFEESQQEEKNKEKQPKPDIPRKMEE